MGTGFNYYRGEASHLLPVHILSLLLLLVTSLLFPQPIPNLTTRDGTWWVTLTPEEKAYFIHGYITGAYSVWKHALIPSLIPYIPFNIEVTHFVSRIDLFYSTPNNQTIPLYYALQEIYRQWYQKPAPDDDPRRQHEQPLPLPKPQPLFTPGLRLQTRWRSL